MPILVAPLIIARQWLQVTGDVAFLRQHPEIMRALQGIVDDLLALQSPGEVLYPSRFSSDGPVGRRYDHGTNVKVYSAFDSFAYLLRHLGFTEEAERYITIAQGILAAIDRTMCFDGPFGTQVSGGTNLGEAPGDFYLPEGVPYYDGEDTSSMLAPIYGACDFMHEPWVNYHRFARSMWCANYDPEFDVLRWGPGENGVFDGTAYFSRLGGSLTRVEMREAIRTLRQNGTDDATGSVFWWPHGREYKRALTRCSQGQGAWAWQYLQQWLGLGVDAVERVLVLAPRGLLTVVEWEGFAAGHHRFDVRWVEDGKRVVATVTNNNDTAWTLRIGFRPSGAGAEGVLAWQTQTLAAGATITLEHQVQMVSEQDSMDQAAVLRRETVDFGDAEGVVFRRFGPALLWGHWETELLWDTRAMPLSMRFVVVNATGKDWADVVVHLSVPEGWSAQGRLPTHWTRPDNMTGGTVRLHLGVLRHMTRTVAPFWVRGPRAFEIRPGWTDDTKPFHAATQPGPGLLVASPDVGMASEAMFAAELRATSHDGTVMSRS
ncbi:MAG: hypothetical protein M1546_13535 [Chloroflexi bacterium]|nr:hypothetical protein [Chloroflexota bacterium]